MIVKALWRKNRSLYVGVAAALLTILIVIGTPPPLSHAPDWAGPIIAFIAGALIFRVENGKTPE